MKNNYLKAFIFAFLSLFFCCIEIQAQENLIYDRIQREKAAKQKFLSLPKLFIRDTNKNSPLKTVKNINEVEYLKYSTKNIDSLHKNIEFILPLKSGNMALELVEVTEAFYSYRVIASGGSKSTSSRKIRHYRGIIKDNPNSLVTISFVGDEVIGLISNKLGNYTLSLNRESKQYLFSKDTNTLERNSFKCISPVDTQNYNEKVLTPQLKTTINSNRKCIRFYLETEYDIYQDMGSVANVEGYVAAMMNQVSALYENENIETSISEIYVWNTPDPYTASNTTNLLSQFQSNTNSINGDLGQLLTFRSIGGGKAAGFAGLCNSNVDEKLSVSGIYNYFNSVSSYSWTVNVVTHEFGHLFGSKHTQACVWNGNNTAIDGCESSEGNCPTAGLPPNGGTIMSYCHLVPGVGINFSNGFGQQPGNVIRNSVVYAACLNQCFSGFISGKTELCDSEIYTVNNLPSGSIITWGTSNTAAVSISVSGNSAVVTRLNSFNGEVIITATISNLPYSQIYILNKGVQVGVPNVNFSGRIYFNMGIPVNPLDLNPCEYEGRGNFEYRDDLGNSSELTAGYEFEVINDPNWYFDMSRSPIADFVLNPSYVGNLSIAVRVKNTCGWSLDYFYLDINKPFCSNNHRYTVYPNPTSKELLINTENINTENLKGKIKIKKNDFEVKLLNNKGIQVRSGKTSVTTDNIILDVSNLSNGIYYLHIFEGKEVIKKQIIISH